MRLLALLLALLLDRLLGEPRSLHPLVGFGQWASWLERQLNRSQFAGPGRIALGLLAWLAAVLPIFIPLLLFYRSWPEGRWLLDALAGYLCIAHQSLKEHVLAVYQPLVRGDLQAARLAVGRIVSRETQHLDAQGVRKAAIESALENGADAVFAPSFWLLVGGAPAVVFYRLANTLDAMWGYRNLRYHLFGRVAARLDDLLNWLPARLTAASFVLLGKSANAWRAWREQAPACASPNAGPVMAAGAGSLGIELGGAAIYHGEVEARPALGFGPPPEDADLLRALRLVRNTLVLWCVLLTSAGLALWVWGK